MEKKLLYTTPETELIEVRTEASLLTVSGGSSGANGSAMGNVDWDAWDPEG